MPDNETINRHELKTHPPYFAAVRSGAKRFEIRKNDRNFQVGDTLQLLEWEPNEYTPHVGQFTGNKVEVRVTYIAQGVFGLPVDVCVMSIAALEAGKAVDENGLKPCPFCGSRAAIHRFDDMDIVECDACPAQMSSFALWNRRTGDAG
jgi:hypothetical protein